MYRPPSDFGADIVVGEGQALGIPVGFGGPYAGLFACREKFVRQMPGRIVGRTTDLEGRTGYVLTLQTREQHIRRERATSNICTSTQLIALQATIYVQALGPRGLRRVAELCYEKAHYAAGQIADRTAFAVEDDEPFFHEFVVHPPRGTAVADVNARLMERGIIGGYDVSDYVRDGLLLCVTEMNTRAEIDALVEALADA
jgi:glycine dehydrogenase subunit 1